MKLRYYFDDVDFDFEIDEVQITDFLINKFLEDSQTPRTFESVQVVKFMIRDLDLCNDTEYLESYEDEITDYFEDDARDCWEDSKCYEEDKADWFGTKYNVIGL